MVVCRRKSECMCAAFCDWFNDPCYWPLLSSFIEIWSLVLIQTVRSTHLSTRRYTVTMRRHSLVSHAPDEIVITLTSQAYLWACVYGYLYIYIYVYLYIYIYIQCAARAKPPPCLNWEIVFRILVSNRFEVSLKWRWKVPFTASLRYWVRTL